MTIVAAYIDGGLASANPSPHGGSWSYVLVGKDGDVAAYDSGLVRPADLGLETVSSNLMELIAAIRALQKLPAGWSGTAYTDSKVTWERLRNPKAGMRGVPAKVLEELRAAQQRVGNRFQIILLEGHPSKAELSRGVGKGGQPVSRFNELCDRLCKQQSSLAKPQKDVPPGDEEQKLVFD